MNTDFKKQKERLDYRKAVVRARFFARGTTERAHYKEHEVENKKK